MSTIYIPTRPRRIIRSAFGPNAILTAEMRQALEADEAARVARDTARCEALNREAQG